MHYLEGSIASLSIKINKLRWVIQLAHLESDGFSAGVGPEKRAVGVIGQMPRIQVRVAQRHIEVCPPAELLQDAQRRLRLHLPAGPGVAHAVERDAFEARRLALPVPHPGGEFLNRRTPPIHKYIARTGADQFSPSAARICCQRSSTAIASSFKKVLNIPAENTAARIEIDRRAAMGRAGSS